MNYSLTFLEEQYTALTDHLFSDRNIERAAYLLCGTSNSDTEVRLLVRQVIPVTPDEIETATAHGIVIKQHSYRNALKDAHLSNASFVFVHSHPQGLATHSEQDDREEPDLFRAAYNRIHSQGAVHASIVISDPSIPRGRVWLRNGNTIVISRIRIIGRRFIFVDPNEQALLDIALFDRQILAFGEHVQKLLSRLHVGIVGLGGTGSAVCEQLTRLGVGSLTICDPQKFESTNINRVYGSRMSDQNLPKTEIAARSTSDIGIGTRVESFGSAITDLAVARKFKDCDVIFGCTDDEWGRSILSRLSIMHVIPVFDMGVEVDPAEDGSIRSVRGRVTTLMPGSACLFCRGGVTPDVIEAEILNATQPSEYEKRRQEGYVPGLPGPAPAVITFTSSVAAAAISELLHRFTGYMGSTRQSTELILRFDESKVSTNSKPAKPGCWCSDPATWAAGDVDPFLDLTWLSSTT
jgi:molybdopterin/thiamine biosynthesis adenylyltransferase